MNKDYLFSMNLLIQVRKSSLSKIYIRYGKDVFKFNLIDVLKISEQTLEKELKKQPSYYGFCLLLNKKLNTHYEELCQERKRVYARLYLHAKEQRTGKNGRGYSDDAAKAYVIRHPKYAKATRDCIIAKDSADTIYSIVRAFEQRKDLMQTLSSNLRKEK